MTSVSLVPCHALVKLSHSSLFTHLICCRNFKAVADLVVSRIKDMPRHQVMMFWHNALLEAFLYLTFKRL